MQDCVSLPGSRWQVGRAGSGAAAPVAGRNVAAGMTGGLGYFYDEEGDFTDKVNAEIVRIQRVRTAAGEGQLKTLISDHVERTGAAALRASPLNHSQPTAQTSS